MLVMIKALPPLLAVMEPSDPRNANDLGRRRRSELSRPALRRISQLRMDSIGVVVVNVLAEQVSKMVLVQDDHVIE